MSDTTNFKNFESIEELAKENGIEVPEFLLQQPEANRLELKTSDWEDDMITDLVTKLKISEDIVLEIMSNILTNEVQAKLNHKDCLLSNIENYLESKYTKPFDTSDWGDDK